MVPELEVPELIRVVMFAPKGEVSSGPNPPRASTHWRDSSASVLRWGATVSATVRDDYGWLGRILIRIYNIIYYDILCICQCIYVSWNWSCSNLNRDRVIQWDPTARVLWVHECLSWSDKGCWLWRGSARRLRKGMRLTSCWQGWWDSAGSILSDCLKMSMHRSWLHIQNIKRQQQLKYSTGDIQLGQRIWTTTHDHLPNWQFLATNLKVQNEGLCQL